MLEEIIGLLRKARKVVALTGAGISAESGVPTFRGKEGLWGKFRPEELATMDAFLANPKIVWEWYNWRRELIGKVQPNPGHYALARFPEFFRILRS
jgi:NAD-dependent deacetylase